MPHDDEAVRVGNPEARFVFSSDANRIGFGYVGSAMNSAVPAHGARFRIQRATRALMNLLHDIGFVAFNRIAEHETNIWGYIDAFDQDRFICGWAEDRNAPGKLGLKIVVELNRNQVAAGHAVLERKDEMPGFRIDTAGKVSLLDVAERRVRVFGLGSDGRKVELVRWNGLSTLMIRRLFPRDTN